MSGALRIKMWCFSVADGATLGRRERVHKVLLYYDRLTLDWRLLLDGDEIRTSAAGDKLLQLFTLSFRVGDSAGGGGGGGSGGGGSTADTTAGVHLARLTVDRGGSMTQFRCVLTVDGEEIPPMHKVAGDSAAAQGLRYTIQQILVPGPPVAKECDGIVFYAVLTRVVDNRDREGPEHADGREAEADADADADAETTGDTKTGDDRATAAAVDNCRVLRRFSEFVELERTIRATILGSKHLASSLPSLPSRFVSPFTDQHDSGFIQERAQQCELFLRALSQFPKARTHPEFLSFLGLDPVHGGPAVESCANDSPKDAAETIGAPANGLAPAFGDSDDIA